MISKASIAKSIAVVLKYFVKNITINVAVFLPPSIAIAICHCCL